MGLSPAVTRLSYLGLLLVFTLLAIDSIQLKSQTFDEGNHLVRGLYPLAGRGFVLNWPHPPLANLLQALPVHFTQQPFVPEAVDPLKPFPHSAALLWSSGNDGVAMIRQARYVTVLFGLCLGMLLYRWAAELHGRQGALFTLFLFALSPNVLAHSRLVTTDLPHAFGIVLFLYALWKLLCRPSPRQLLLTGLALGVAAAIKHTAILWAILSFAVLIGMQISGRLELRAALGTAVGSGNDSLLARLRVVLLACGGISIAAFIVIWASYGFSLGSLNGDRGLIPAAAYFRGLLQLFLTVQDGRQFYLEGQFSSNGWWYYFPLAILYKTPLPTMILTVGGLLILLTHKVKLARGTAPMVVIALLFLLTAMVSGLNLGLRHILPLYPLLFLLLGGLLNTPIQPLVIKLVLIINILWYALSTIYTHPDHLAYFNELTHPDSRHHHFVDANLDWGQDLPALANLANDRQFDLVQLGYFGTAEPAAYGIRYLPLPSFLAQSPSVSPLAQVKCQGLIAVSATLLQGLYVQPSNFYAPLRHIKPDASLGGSIFVYDFRAKPGCE